MILTPAEQAQIATLKAQIAERVAQAAELRKAKRKIEMTGYQRARRQRAAIQDGE
jgi:hypothetical protein